MEFGVGAVLDGKVTGITKFGAFVSLAEGKSGMVHISEIANTYVTDIREHLAEGQSVTVRIIGIDTVGRINLSIKKALEPVRTARPAPARRTPREPAFAGAARPSESFEDKLSKFLSDSSSKMSGSKLYGDSKRTKRRPR